MHRAGSADVVETLKRQAIDNHMENCYQRLEQDVMICVGIERWVNSMRSLNPCDLPPVENPMSDSDLTPKVLAPIMGPIPE